METRWSIAAFQRGLLCVHVAMGAQSAVGGGRTMPHGRAYRFEDPHQLQATLRAGSFDVFANSRVGFDAELIRIDLDRLWMQRCSSRHDWLLRTSNDPKRAP